MATLIISKEIQNEDEIMEDQNEDDESSFMTNESSYYAREDLELKAQLVMTPVSSRWPWSVSDDCIYILIKYFFGGKIEMFRTKEY